MKTVGIRELRQRASDLIRQVENGASFEVTDRGRAVAILGPLPRVEPLERLRAQGELTSATGDLDDLPPPIAPQRSRPRLSSLLAKARADER